MKGLLLGFLIAFSLAAFTAKVTEDLFTLGISGSGVDKQINAAGTTGSIYYDVSESKWVGTNDGSVVKDLLGGGASGGSGAYNNLDNPNFEDGIATNWECSLGDCSEDSSTPLFGSVSVTYEPETTSDYLRSDFKAIPEGMIGQSCEARVRYTADSDEILTLRVVNQDLEVIASLDLPQSGNSARVESLFFLCPNVTEIVADSDKGVLRLEVVPNTNTAVVSEFDDMHLGLLIGLVETTLPDKFSASFDGSAGAGITKLTESSTGAFDCAFNATGLFDCTIATPLTVIPTINCEVTENIGGRECAIRNKTTSTFTVNITKTNDLTVENRDFDIFIEKQGTDAKQSVQVYKSIPKVADNINVFSATVSTATGAVTQENVNWLETTCATGTSPTQAVCDLEISLDEELSCAVAFESGTGARSATVLSTTTQITISSTISSSGADAGGNTAIICVKSGNDFKLPTVQPVIVGQVRNSHAESASKNVRVESCRVANAGTPTANGNYCSSWIDSITDSGVGDIEINISPNIFSLNPDCQVTAVTQGATGRASTVDTETVAVDTRDTGNSPIDTSFQILCFGEY